jgi:DNA-binding GntR family transcriptional regulator
MNQMGKILMNEQECEILYNTIKRPNSIVEDITNKLSEAIFDGRIGHGQQIIETELQRALGVSRAPIREALLKLEGQGLVNIIPRKGCFVRTITPVYIQEIFTVRAWLEGLAARLFAEEIRPENLEELDKILKDMAILSKRKDFRRYFERHADFHMVFISGSRNTFLIEKIKVLRRQSLWLPYSVIYFEKNHKNCQRIHSSLLDLFGQKNVDKIERAVRNHILDAIGYYVEYVKSLYFPKEYGPGDLTEDFRCTTPSEEQPRSA